MLESEISREGIFEISRRQKKKTRRVTHDGHEIMEEGGINGAIIKPPDKWFLIDSTRNVGGWIRGRDSFARVRKSISLQNYGGSQSTLFHHQPSYESN